MACSIPVSSISVEQSNRILKELTFIEKVECFRGKSRTPNIIEMCQVEGSFVKLPMHYAIREFGYFPNDLRSYPTIDVKLKSSPRDYQLPVVDEMIDQFKKTASSTLALYPAFGKTFMGAVATTYLKLKTCIIVNCEILLNQWEKTYLENTDCTVQIINSKTKKVKDVDVYICMNQQLKKLESIKDSIGLAIFDEAHLLCTPTNVKTWLFLIPKYILVETATPERPDGLHAMAQSVAGGHFIYRQRPDKFTVIKLNTGIKFKKYHEGRKLDYNQGLDLLISDPTRIHIIVEVMKMFIDKGAKIIGLSKRTTTCEVIMSLVQERYPHIRIDSLYGKKKSHVDGDVLVGTVSKIGTGYDQASFCKTYDGKRFSVLILMEYVKGLNKLIQTTGRVSRCEDPIVVQIYDEYSAFQEVWRLNNHYYQSIGAVVEEMRF